MKAYKLAVQKDHVERIARGRRPVAALAELVWNALDADASSVSVSFERDLSGGIVEIRVVDDGLGISETDAVSGFSMLGGSWKRNRDRTRGRKRALHGKEGKGRFAAFVLGADVIWRSVAETPGGRSLIVIRGKADDLLNFVGEDAADAGERPVGTEVRVLNVFEGANALLNAESELELSEVLAFYLKKYPDVRVVVGDSAIRPAAIQLQETVVDLPPLAVDNRLITDAKLTIVEWARPMPKSLHLCDAEGFTLHTMQSGIRAPGVEYSAYLSSAVVRELYEANELSLPELSPTVQTLHEAARGKLREFARARRAAAAASMVDDWKKQGVYPYAGEPSGTTETSERQVFEIVAANVQEYSPDFASVDTKTKRLSFQLVRQAIETNPSSMQRILADVLGLPKEKQDELAELLERTSLTAVISAAKVVADRLDVVRAIETLVHDPEHSKTLLERRQLQRIVVDHTWMFGEQYHLAVDDQSLTEVLLAHRHLVTGSPRSAREKARKERVTRLDGTDGIVDMMLSKSISRADGLDREHLIVELKRPDQKIDKRVLSQTVDYALAVANDPRFREVPTKWVFWAVSTEMDAHARLMTRQANLPRGVHLVLNDDVDVTVIAKTWAEVVEECRGRLRFFKEQLEWKADRGAALETLRKTHGRYFPKSVEDELSSKFAGTDDPARVSSDETTQS